MRRRGVGLTGLIVVVIAGLGFLLSRPTPAASPAGKHVQTNIVSPTGGSTGSATTGGAPGSGSRSGAPSYGY
jgi:hypothetical protein